MPDDIPNMMEFMLLKAEMIQIARKAARFEEIVQQVAVVEAFQKQQDSRINRLEMEISSLGRDIARQQFGEELLTEERSENRKQNSQLAKISNQIEELKEARAEMRDTLDMIKNVILGRQAEGVVINVKNVGGNGGDKKPGESASIVNVAGDLNGDFVQGDQEKPIAEIVELKDPFKK